MEKATCQVCGREIKASTGLIAHHGYTRPYEGWQTSSCAGARYVPYEISCERLKEVTEGVKSWITNQEIALEDFLATPPQTITVMERRSSWGKGEEVVYEKPEDFNPNSYKSSIPRTYENVYSNKKYDREQALKMSKYDLSNMERRIEEWTPVVVEVQA